MNVSALWGDFAWGMVAWGDVVSQPVDRPSVLLVGRVQGRTLAGTARPVLTGAARPILTGRDP